MAFEILNKIKQEKDISSVPVIVFSNLSEEKVLPAPRNWYQRVYDKIKF